MRFGLEKTLMYVSPKSYPPTYFVYYCSAEADIFGRLMFFEYEMVFEPLEPRFRGFFNYTEGDVFQNGKKGFVVNFKDLAATPKIFMKADQSKHLQC